MKFTEEKNTLMLISLMKAHGIRKVIASPGATNVALVASLQNDAFFQVFSAVDERSAAYIACGMAAESGEPVALSCTQATASRNYLSGLTEAYYRKLPILAITSTQHIGRIGQNCQQAIDRSIQPVDAVKLSVQVPIIHTEEDEWYCNVLLNSALLELRHNGGGPVHINLTTTYSKVFNVGVLPETRVIQRIGYKDILSGKYPSIDGKRIAIFVGSHKKWNDDLVKSVDEFCEKYNAVVFCDQTSNYKGKYRINASLAIMQPSRQITFNKDIDLMIYIGDVSGAGLSFDLKEVWRVNPDGEIRDLFRKETYVFEMEEVDFFKSYASIKKEKGPAFYYERCRSELNKIVLDQKKLPFSNGWIASQTIKKLPANSILHLGIYNSLRMWNYFEPDDSVLGYSNTGGFGIDGGMSSAIGATLCTDNLVFLVIGDLAFFYDINSLCNRHLKNNIRILLINNGLGVEFKNSNNRAYSLGDYANSYIAAYGHNGKQSETLVKHYAQDLGFKYICAHNKEEFLKHLDEFTDTEVDQPIIYEVFVDYTDDVESFDNLSSLLVDESVEMKKMAKVILGEKGTKVVKTLLEKR